MRLPWTARPGRGEGPSSSAVISAGARGIFIAMRVATMKVSRWVWRTMTGASGMAAGSSEAGDLDAGVLQLVAPVDRGEDRGDALERPGVGERADVDRAQAHRAGQLAHGLLGHGVGAAQEKIALDRVTRLGQLVGGDEVGGGGHFRVRQQ